jgi:hypothetical protein
VVAQSSCESEYIVAANAMCQALWLTHVLADVQGSTLSTPLLRVDNKSALTLIKNPILHGQRKHIKVEFIRSEEQLGDILMNLLGRVKFLELHAKIGLIDVDGHNKS